MLKDNNALKQMLSEIKKNDYAVPEGLNPYTLAIQMMDNIGSLDPELRDELIHSVLSNWIIKGVFSNEQTLELLEMNLDDRHLFFKLGEEADDSVFKRAFCMLNIACIIYYHRNNNLLPDDKVREVKEKIVDYYSRERDLRGYVQEKGWAHSAAHGADTLDELALCNSLGQDDLIDILASIRDKVCISCYTFINQEDERMVNAVESALKRRLLGDAEIASWIKSFKDAIKEEIYPQHHTLITNIKSFLRSLYFRLLEEDGSKAIVDEIRETLNHIK